MDRGGITHMQACSVRQQAELPAQQQDMQLTTRISAACVCSCWTQSMNVGCVWNTVSAAVVYAPQWCGWCALLRHYIMPHVTHAMQSASLVLSESATIAGLQ
jgi:hypothetical protein